MPNQPFLPAVGKFFKDLIFPVRCVGCKTEGAWICSICQPKISLLAAQVCHHCEKNPTPFGQTCFACRGKTFLDGILVSSNYQNELVSRSIWFFKYRFIPELAEPLAELMLETLTSLEVPLPDVIAPVPLHQRRLRWRGFNQAWLLAKNLGEKITPGFPIRTCENLLIRKKYTTSQMKIKDYGQRKINLQEAFCLNQDVDLTNLSVLLVDDVATTGATLEECARLLKQAGAKNVLAVVIARQALN